MLYRTFVDLTNRGKYIKIHNYLKNYIILFDYIIKSL